MVKRLDNRGDSESGSVIRDMTNDVPSEFIEWAANAVIHWSPPVKHCEDIIHNMERPTIFSFKRIKMPLPINNVSQCNEYDYE